MRNMRISATTDALKVDTSIFGLSLFKTQEDFKYKEKDSETELVPS